MTVKLPSEMNVIVIDNEERICELVRLFLETTFSFKSVVTAENTVLASQKMSNQDFDLLIIDHVMPGKFGIEFVEMLKLSVKRKSIKVLVISGFLNQDDVIKYVQLGVKNILVKPFRREQLVRQVAELLDIKFVLDPTGLD